MIGLARTTANLALVAIGVTVFLNLGFAALRLVVAQAQGSRRYGINDHFPDAVLAMVTMLLVCAGVVGYGLYNWLP